MVDVPVLLYDLELLQPAQLPITLLTFIDRPTAEEVQTLILKHMRNKKTPLLLPRATVVVVERKTTVNDTTPVPAEGTEHARAQGYILDAEAIDAALAASQTP